MLTKAQRKRLAREARKLAMECVEGTAPPLIAGDFVLYGQHCVLGEVGVRGGLAADNRTLWNAFYGGAWGDDAAVAAGANNTAAPEDRHAAAVFHLLALADALEAA